MDKIFYVNQVLDKYLTIESFEHLNLYKPDGRMLSDEERNQIFASLFDYSRRELYWNLGRALDPEEFQAVLGRVKEFIAKEGLE